MTKRATLLFVIVLVGVMGGVFLSGRAFFQKAKAPSVATCVYDPGKATQDCTCPAVSDAERALTTCLIHETNGSLKIVDGRETDAGMRLVLTDASGAVMDTPSISTWTGYHVKRIQKEQDGRYFVELASPIAQKSAFSEQNFHRYLRISFLPTPSIVDMSKGSDLLLVRYQGQEADEEGNVYGFMVGKDITKPVFTFVRLNIAKGLMTEIADLTKTVKGSGLQKQLQNPYTYWLDLTGGYDGRPFVIRASPQGMTDEPSLYYEMDVVHATLKRIKVVTW